MLYPHVSFHSARDRYRGINILRQLQTSFRRGRRWTSENWTSLPAINQHAIVTHTVRIRLQRFSQFSAASAVLQFLRKNPCNATDSGVRQFRSLFMVRTSRGKGATRTTSVKRAGARRTRAKGLSVSVEAFNSQKPWRASVRRYC